ncbi:DMT family transporter [Streptomyces cinnamoneus]|uniref:DMT family transporter n=1 Tax=Streptomyces cinnamoneus TaxID=53446 RepID=UPI00379F965B
MAETTEQRRDPVDAYFYLLATMAFFGSAFTSSKVVVGHVPHQVAAALRFGGGALILVLILAVAARGGRIGSFSWRDAVRAGLVGLLGVFAYNVFFFWGLSLAPSIDGSIIVPVLSPVLTTGALLVMGRETASTARVVGLVLGVAGAVVFFLGIGDGGGGVSGKRLLGDAVYLLGAAAWAAYSITSKRVLAGMEPLRATTYGTVAGALGLVVLAVPSVPDVDWGGLSGGVWANVVYLAIGPTAIAYLCFYRGLRSVSPSTATVVMFAVPVFGVTSSGIFLDESFTAVQVVGGVIMLAGALLAVTQGRFLRRPGGRTAAAPAAAAPAVAAPRDAGAS